MLENLERLAVEVQNIPLLIFMSFAVVKSIINVKVCGKESHKNVYFVFLGVLFFILYIFYSVGSDSIWDIIAVGWKPCMSKTYISEIGEKKNMCSNESSVVYSQALNTFHWFNIYKILFLF